MGGQQAALHLNSKIIIIIINYRLPHTYTGTFAKKSPQILSTFSINGYMGEEVISL